MAFAELETLNEFLTTGQQMTHSAKDELHYLRGDLVTLNEVIADMYRSQDMDKLGSREYEIKKLRSILYEVEDTIDSFITNPTSKNLAKEIKSLRHTKVKPAINWLRELISRRATSSDSTDQKEQQPIRIKALRQDNVVGLEEQIDTLIQKLNEESNELDVLSIVGMPGLGKTTLAWNIYRNPRIRSEFPVLIWVHVSQDYKEKNVLLAILKKFIREDMHDNPIEKLIELVCHYLCQIKFLIFFDDVWTVHAWEKIKNCLPKSNAMGKVLMTTRDALVARYANRFRSPHQLDFLSEEKSLELLHIEVNGAEDETYPEDVEFYRRIIAKKCGGLPIAIELVGGILVDKFSTTGDTKRAWKMVSEDVMGYVFHEDEGKNLENIISTSYESLSYKSRDCLLYLGIFPEDAEISAWKLIQLWIAEGFVKHGHGHISLEHIAQDYLNELIHKNLVMVKRTKINGVKTCSVHNMVREFCQKLACYERQNLFEEIRKSEDGHSKTSCHVIQKCHRLSVHSYVHDFFLKKLKVPKIRSFLSNSTETINIEEKDIQSITDAFDLLRVFDVDTIKFPKFPAKFTKLVHLRYITLSGGEIKTLPEAMFKLWNLQTLTVDTTSSTLEIKVDITKMEHLRHLKTNASIILNKDLQGTGGEKLQTITRVSPQSCTEEFFNKARNLKTLGIRGELATLPDSNCLEKLDRLEELKLINHLYLKVACENPLPRLPLRFPPNIKCLTLSNTYLDWKQMSEVGYLRGLEVLKLKDYAFVGDLWEARVGGFRQLEFLYIEHTDLMFWTTSEDSFPKLRSLSLKNCQKLEEVPFELGMNLQFLCLERTTKSAVLSAEKIKQAKVEELGRAQKGGFKLIIAPGDHL